MMKLLQKLLANPFILQSLWSLIARFTGVALNFAVILVITNRLSKIEAGDLLLLMQFVTGVALFSRLGIDQLLIKEVASSHESHSDFRSTYLKRSYFAVFSLSLVFIAIWLILSPAIRSAFFDNGSDHIISLSDLMLASIGVLFFNLVILNSTYLKAIKKTVAGVLGQNALPAVSFLFFIGIFWDYFTEKQHYINLYTASNVLAGVLAVIITWRYLQPAMPAKKSNGNNEGNTGKESRAIKKPDAVPNVYAVIKKSMPLAPVSIFAYLMLFADTIMVGWFLTNDQVADYSVAAKLSYIILFFLQALEATIYPRLLNTAKQNPDRLPGFFWQSTSLVIGVVSVVTLVMYLFSDWILVAFGESYTVAKHALGLLLLAQLLRSASLTFSFMFIIREKVRYLNIILVVSLIINLLCNIIFIKMYGIEGAALATLIANGILLFSVLGLFYLKKLLLQKTTREQIA